MIDWILLAVLVIIWTALLVPAGPRGRRATQGDFSVFTEPERRVLMPRERLLGSGSRARRRARERRRRVLAVLVEGIALTALIGLFPPLRGMWVATGILVVALTVYVSLLLRLRVEQQADRPLEVPTVSARSELEVAPDGQGRRGAAHLRRRAG